MQKLYPQVTPATEQPSRLVYLWSEVRATSAEPTLKGEPNAIEKKYKDKEGNEVSTEDPKTAQGRNVIRGQAIMMLRRFPYESDSKDLHDAIAASRRAEMGLKEEGQENPMPPTIKGSALKDKLDEFRKAHTTVDEKTKAVSFNAPSHLTLELEYLTAIPDGRNFLRAEAMKRLKLVPPTEENKGIRDALRNSLAMSTKIETGQWYNEIDPETKKKREAPAGKAEKEKDKEQAADDLLVALNALPAPAKEEKATE